MVALVSCRNYEREHMKRKIDQVLRALPKPDLQGLRVLLKPNLVSGAGHDGLAVTHPQFVRALAEWFIDCGSQVAVGDSPAFGSAMRVMQACGLTDALVGLPVTRLSFTRKTQRITGHGLSVTCAAEVFEHDFVVNLPKLKAHSQMGLTLAVKNYFGMVLGWRKALLHMRHGCDHGQDFIRLLVDLLAFAPEGLSVIDGVVGMHKSGPIKGEPFAAGFIGGSANPVALDTAVLRIVGCPEESSPVWCESARRGMKGANREDCTFPLLRPEQLAVAGFLVPQERDPVRFQLKSFGVNIIKRILIRS